MLRVKTLGGFQLFQEKRPVSLGKQPGGNVVKLFMLLLLNLKTGIPRAQLLREMFYWVDRESDLGANLRITAYRLRRALKAAGIPAPEGEDYICIGNGNYSWNRNIPVWLDVFAFREMAGRACGQKNQEESFRLGEAAMKLYEGEFLPELSSEEWVNRIQLELVKVYRKLFLNQYRILKERRSSKAAYELAKSAVAIYPFEEYQLYMMDCLADLKHYIEATKLYEQTAREYQKMGLEFSENMKNKIREIGSWIAASSLTLDGIRQMLRVQPGKGWEGSCSLTSFTDYFHFAKGLLERSGQPAYLLVITLENEKKLPLEPKEQRTQDAADVLEKVIRSRIHSGDLAARYDAATFLVFLACVDEAGCQTAEEKIRQGFREGCAYKKVRLDFRIAPVTEASQRRDG